MNRQLEQELYHESVHCLVNALEAKDIYTKGHSIRVGDMAYELARSLNISEDLSEIIHIAGHLHDIGKIGISESILNKEGDLTDFEWSEMKKHPKIGYDILAESERLKEISFIVLSHHERWDGKGYPNNLFENQIPFGARIIAICDSIDAMTSNRKYRKSFNWDYCWEQLIKNSGTQFDPYIISNLEKIFLIWRKKYENILTI